MLNFYSIDDEEFVYMIDVPSYMGSRFIEVAEFIARHVVDSKKRGFGESFKLFVRQDGEEGSYREYDCLLELKCDVVSVEDARYEFRQFGQARTSHIVYRDVNLPEVASFIASIYSPRNSEEYRVHIRKNGGSWSPFLCVFSDEGEWVCVERDYDQDL